MTTGGREILKWLALVAMTCDHIAQVIAGGYVPVLSEVGRIAFPIFAMVMAYNLAQPGADVAKSVRRLAGWGIVAQVPHALAFGNALPLNVLLAFAVAASCVWSIQRRHWPLLVLMAGPVALFVDYAQAGLLFVLAFWWLYRLRYSSHVGLIDIPQLYLRGFAAFSAFGLLCFYNGNGWAFLALPVVMAFHTFGYHVPRTRWAFYGYYVGHLSLLAAAASFLIP